MEKELDKKQVIAELAKSPHGDLTEFLKVGIEAAQQEPGFFAHLVAWNHVKGEVRDSKIALPLIALTTARRTSNLPTLVDPLMENALAHLADLNPRMLGKGLLSRYKMEIVVDPKNPKRKMRKRVLGSDGEPIMLPPFAQFISAPSNVLRRFVTRYLRDLETDRKAFERVAVQHSRVLMDLYAHFHVSRPDWAGAILFHGEKLSKKQGSKNLPPEGTVFAAIRNMRHMTPTEAAGVIQKWDIPFIVARAAAGDMAKDPAVVQALMSVMSPTELVTNMKWLETVGVKKEANLRSALDVALGKAATNKTAARATLKTSRAAEALAGDEKLSGKLQILQEKQIEKAASIEGDWLVFVDKSGSMKESIHLSRPITSTLARSIKGKVHMIFFDYDCYYFDATGKTLEELTALTAQMNDGGGTDMANPVKYAIDRKLIVNGMVFIGDGANHGGPVSPWIKKYAEKFDIEPTLYFYKLSGEPDNFSTECRREGMDLQTFDLIGKNVDYYSIPNLVQTMRVSRFKLLDEIMETKLRTLDEVLDRTVGMQVLPKMVVNA